MTAALAGPNPNGITRSDESATGSPPAPPASFTRHRYELPMLWVFFAIAFLELFAVHLLVSLWSATAAWILSALTVLGLAQIGTLIHGLIRWPTVIDDRHLTVRHGRRGEIAVPLARIRSIQGVAFLPEEKGKHVFRATLLAQPNLAIHLSEPLPYGRRMLECITLRLDEPELFRAALDARLEGRKG